MKIRKLTRSEQSRLNGTQSKGPTSQEGKAKSSANSLKHGFAAVINVVLEIEDKPAFQLHAQKLRASYKPQDYAEECYVDQLASITWRQGRLVGLETALQDHQLSIQQRYLEAQNPESGTDPYFKLVQAWEALARQPRPPTSEELADPTLPSEGHDVTSFELLRRYQTSLDRQHRNALLNLQLYRKTFGTNAPTPNASPAPPNEPEKPQPLRILTFPTLENSAQKPAIAPETPISTNCKEEINPLTGPMKTVPSSPGANNVSPEFSSTPTETNSSSRNSFNKRLRPQNAKEALPESSASSKVEENV